MLDGRWWLISDVAIHLGVGEPTIVTALQNLRKIKHGHHRVDRRNRGGLFYYRLWPEKTHVKRPRQVPLPFDAPSS